ncbi:12124_t:CDS:2, partial [Ambispora leptoticha]
NVHAAVEEMVFYPAIGKYLNDGQDLVDHTRHDHEVVKTALDKLDCIAVIDPEYEEKLRKAMKNLFEHVREEEEEILPKFKKVVSGKILEELGKKFNEARRHYVPPRPHPSVSETEKSCKENNAQENATVTDKNEPCEYVDTGQVC